MKKIKTEDLDSKFDRGEDIMEYVDVSSARRINREVKRVNIDFPTWVVHKLDNEAQKLGVTRQSLVKMWIAEKIR